MLIKSQSEVRLHTGRSVHFHPGRCARPSFSIFRGSGSETIQLRCTRTNTPSNYVAHAPIQHPITLHTHQYAIQLRCTCTNTPSNYVAHVPIRHPITLHTYQYAIQLRCHPITLHTYQYAIQLRCTHTNTPSNYTSVDAKHHGAA